MNRTWHEGGYILSQTQSVCSIVAASTSRPAKRPCSSSLGSLPASDHGHWEKAFPAAHPGPQPSDRRGETDYRVCHPQTEGGRGTRTRTAPVSAFFPSLSALNGDFYSRRHFAQSGVLLGFRIRKCQIVINLVACKILLI